MTYLVATALAALIAALVAPWAKARIDKRKQNDDENASAKASLAKVTDERIEQLFREYARMRDTYRSDLDDMRAQLRDSSQRVGLLEAEVAEWRAGVRGVPGVWIAVPAHVWDFVRANLPDLPPTRFPGEREMHGTVEDELTT